MTDKKQTAKFAKIMSALRSAEVTNKESITTAGSVSDSIAEVYRSGTDSLAWLSYFTRNISSGSITPKEVKLMQNNIGKLGTQRKMLSLDDKAKPTQRIRLMKGNKTLYAEGLCTQEAIEKKIYLWIVDDVKAKSPKTATEKLQAIVDEFNIESMEKLKAIITKLEFN